MAHDLRKLLRMLAERSAQPTAAILDGRTLQSTPESGERAGYDGYKRKKGSKVHIAVDPLGHLRAVKVPAANEQERAPVADLVQQVQAITGGHVEVAFADQGYTGEEPAAQAAEQGVRLVVVKLEEAKRGFVWLPRRWVVERSFAWISGFRRLARAYERLPASVAGLHWLGVVFQEVVRKEGIGQGGGGWMLYLLPSRSNTMHANAALTPLRRAQMVAHSLPTAARTGPPPHPSASAKRPSAAGSNAPATPPSPRASRIVLRLLINNPAAPPPLSNSTSWNCAAPAAPTPRSAPSSRTSPSPVSLSRLLRRHGLQRLANLEPPKPPPIRYEHPHPGDLLHLDIKKLGRFARPGVRATGDRTQRNPGAGVESLHVAIDDHSRLGFACLLPDERTPSVLAALRAAVAFYHDHAIPIRRVLTDRGSTYRSKLFAKTCRELGLQHSFTRPYRPQTNGKAERFIQTLSREWAYARAYDSSDHRATFLPHFLHDYNFHAPTPPSITSLQPPASQNLRTTC
jgi:transposase InsO family protein/transposase